MMNITEARLNGIKWLLPNYHGLTMKAFFENLVFFSFSLFICTVTVYSAAGVDPFKQANALSNQTEIKR